MLSRRVVPVIPGKPEPTNDPNCVACAHGTIVHKEVHAGIEMMLCNDFMACNRRSGVVKR